MVGREAKTCSRGHIDWKSLPSGTRYCNTCHKAGEAAYRQRNAARLAAQSKLWRESNKEYVKSSGKKWRSENREKKSEAGKQWWQKNRHRILASWLRKYGVTLEQYQHMHDRQAGLCAICEKPETQRSSTGYLKRLAVDHHHGTGQIRALLCQACNAAVGLFDEDQERLLAAARYLRSFESKRLEIVKVAT